MKSGDIVEKINVCKEKAGMYAWSISDDPDEVADISFNESGILCLYEQETLYKDDDIERIKFSKDLEDGVNPAYIRIDLKGGEKIYLDAEGGMQAELRKNGEITYLEAPIELLPGLAEAKKRGCDKEEFVVVDEKLISYNGDEDNVIIPDGVTVIIPEVFRGRDITSVTCPESLQEINFKAFSECTKLESVSLNDGLQRIGFEAFSFCGALKNITIPSTVREISHRAFLTSGLEMVDMQDVDRIGNNVFDNTPYNKKAREE